MGEEGWGGGGRCGRKIGRDVEGEGDSKREEDWKRKGLRKMRRRRKTKRRNALMEERNTEGG